MQETLFMPQTAKSKSKSRKAQAIAHSRPPAASPIAPSKSAAPSARSGTKSATVIDLLKSKSGASLAEMMKATGWQAHSVRGFLAGSLRKRHGLAAESEKAADGERRYRVR